ncbi:hypothetical protein [Prescottella agglutinans]|uniref:hypothetical protein n=1 Tax=Prescottella agglutinans TaxID=1644129 RepID=UPI003D97F2F1
MLPPGERHDFQLDRGDDLLQFGGWLTSDTANFVAAVEVSRNAQLYAFCCPRNSHSMNSSD